MSRATGVAVETAFTVINIGTLSINKFWGEEERVRSASATCTLLESGGRRLIVDPSPAPELLEPMLFARTGLRPDAIDAVFLTHFHGDHRFGLGLFEGKTWLMARAGLEEWREKAPADAAIVDRFDPAEEAAADGGLPAGVELFPSSGHTLGHCSLSAPTKWGRLIVAGDAVMTADFFDAKDGFHNSVDFSLVADTIRRFEVEADTVIPGHDNVILTGRGGRA